MLERNIYERLSKLLSYPADDYAVAVETCRRELAGVDPEAAESIAQFGCQLQGLTTEELQELFVQTFDLNPMCALEVGWQLFGDNYDRGDLLVKMRQELQRHGVARTAELPDHLTNVLPLLGRMEDQRAAELVAGSVLPALQKMLAGFGGKQSPYEHVLRAVAHWLQSRHAPVVAEEGR